MTDEPDALLTPTPPPPLLHAEEVALWAPLDAPDGPACLSFPNAI